MTMRYFLALLAERQTLTEEQAADAMRLIMTGSFEAEEVAAFLLGLRSRGETIDELAGFTRVMREFAVRVDAGDPNAIDLCGTGGDGVSTFNISTSCAFVVAGAGVTVAKHGNRSVSSSCGSSDVLSMLGIETRLSGKGVEQCFRDAGMAFIFAPLFHPALGHVMPIRRKLGVRTFFNILGPICNPAFVKRQLIGCFNVEVAEMMSRILSRLGSDRVRVVHSRDGLDEISISDATDSFGFSEQGSTVVHEVIDTRELGIPRIDLNAIRSRSPEENLNILVGVLDGDVGPARDIVLANATYAIQVAGLHESPADCYSAAVDSIDSGAARASLERLRKVSLVADKIQ